jgi:hypothetical protein
MFAGDRGLFVLSPFLIPAFAGLVVCLRRYPLEASVAVTIAFLFLLLEAGYFLPYGGISPGPRFLAPAVPFLCLGLGPALRRWRGPTLALVVVSVISTTAVTLTWALSHDDSHPYRQTVWGEIARWLSQGSSSRLARTVAPNALQWLGLSGTAATAVVAACAVVALIAASLPRRELTSTLAHDG